MYIWFRIKPGDLSSLPYKTVRYVLSTLWLSTNCRMPDSASRFYADPYKTESTRFRSASAGLLTQNSKSSRQSAQGFRQIAAITVPQV